MEGTSLLVDLRGITNVRAGAHSIGPWVSTGFSFMAPLDDLRAIIDQMRIQMPWVDWAKKHPVLLSLRDDILTSTQFFIHNTSELPGVKHDYHLLVHPTLFAQFRTMMNRGAEGTWLVISDQRIAEMIVWYNLEMREPGEESRNPGTHRPKPPDPAS